MSEMHDVNFWTHWFGQAPGQFIQEVTSFLDFPVPKLQKLRQFLGELAGASSQPIRPEIDAVFGVLELKSPKTMSIPGWIGRELVHSSETRN